MTSVFDWDFKHQLLNFESEICFLLKYFKDILASILKIMENVDIFFR